MKTNNIFANGQILTLAIAKTLVGKTISVTNNEYHANSATVRTGKVIGIESEWDLAANEDFTSIDPQYKTRQEYWLSYMTPEQISKQKNKLRLIGDKPLQAGCEINSLCYDEPIFFGSDEDRPIFFIIADEN